MKTKTKVIIASNVISNVFAVWLYTWLNKWFALETLLVAHLLLSLVGLGVSVWQIKKFSSFWSCDWLIETKLETFKAHYIVGAVTLLVAGWFFRTEAHHVAAAAGLMLGSIQLVGSVLTNHLINKHTVKEEGVLE